MSDRLKWTCLRLHIDFKGRMIVRSWNVRGVCYWYFQLGNDNSLALSSSCFLVNRYFPSPSRNQGRSFFWRCQPWQSCAIWLNVTLETKSDVKRRRFITLLSFLKENETAYWDTLPLRSRRVQRFPFPITILVIRWTWYGTYQLPRVELPR